MFAFFVKIRSKVTKDRRKKYAAKNANTNLNTSFKGGYTQTRLIWGFGFGGGVERCGVRSGVIL